MIFKINGGNGAILCGKCRRILKQGKEIPEYIWKAVKSGIVKDLPDICCEECKEFFEQMQHNS